MTFFLQIGSVSLKHFKGYEIPSEKIWQALGMDNFIVLSKGIRAGKKKEPSRKPRLLKSIFWGQEVYIWRIEEEPIKDDGPKVP